MARRGFFAELQHQAKMAEKERVREARAAEKEYKAAVRRAEQARKAELRAMREFERAEEAERKRLKKEAKAARIASMEAKVERQNAELADIYDALDTLLAATLDVDDYVDLDSLKFLVEHPPFDRPDLEAELPPPALTPDPHKPVCKPPPRPSGLGRLFGMGRYHKDVARAEAAHTRALSSWNKEMVRVEEIRNEEIAEHARAEEARLLSLAAEQRRFAEECSARELEIAEQHREIDVLIANLGYGVAEAVQEYVSIVLSNSVYPTQFNVSHDFSFDAETAELRLRVQVPGPTAVPAVKAYKYTKASDEINSVAMSQKASKDRYSGAVQQVALRSFHEVFEADRRGIIKTIALEVGTETLNPATGQQEYVPFVSAGAERNSFLELNLANVVPAATLKHLGAAVSKNPFGLEPADTKGIRRS